MLGIWATSAYTLCHQGLGAQNITLDMLLKMNPQHIGESMRHSDAHQMEVSTLNKALGKLRAWTESQMNGGCYNLTLVNAAFLCCGSCSALRSATSIYS